MAKLTDEEIVSICLSEISNATGYNSGELADERGDAMDYYLGAPYGDEVEGRSQFRSREVLDTIESILPSLCRIFCDSENMVMFDPVGPEDEDQAQQESDRVNHAYWKQNRGFYNTYTFCKDALLSKTGNLKAWWSESPEPEREEYKELSDQELSGLMNDPEYSREILEYKETESGHHVIFLTTQNTGQVVIEPVTPEEFGLNGDARSPYAQDARFCYHRVKKSYGELVALGYDRKVINSIPTNDDVVTQEALSRRYLSDEDDTLAGSSHNKVRNYWITEVYIHLDRDDDGVDELLKVTMATGANSEAAGATKLDIEEVDAIPFFTAAPNIITHKFYGLSIADLVMDIQRIKSTLIRQVLDNAYHSNNQRTAINERVNLDDLLTNRPGGVVRIEGEQDIGNSIIPMVSTPLPQETFGLIEYLDDLRKNRTGSSEEVPALDSKSLASVNASVAAIAYDQARARIELIARILAEVGLKPLFKHVHELLQKNQSKPEVVKLRNKWVEVLPSEWKSRKNMTVMVGLGNASRESRLMALDSIAKKQGELVAAGGMGVMISPHNIYKMLADYTKALGFEPNNYFMDPATVPPKPPEPPSLQDQALMAQAKAQMGAVEAQMQRNQVEMAKVQSQEKIRLAEMQNNQEEIMLRQQLERLRGAQDTAIAEMKQASDREKTAIQAEIKLREQEIRIAEGRLKDNQEAAKREVDMMKAFIASNTALTEEQMKLIGIQDAAEEKERAMAEIKAEVAAVIAQRDDELQELISRQAAMSDALAQRDSIIGELQAKTVEVSTKKPVEIVRDDKGLIISIGDRKVERDESGRAMRVV